MNSCFKFSKQAEYLIAKSDSQNETEFDRNQKVKSNGVNTEKTSIADSHNEPSNGKRRSTCNADFDQNAKDKSAKKVT